MFLYKHAFKCYNDSKERLFDKGNRKITYRKDGPHYENDECQICPK